MTWTKVLSFFLVLIAGGFFIYEGYLGKEAKKKVVSPGRIRAIILGPGLIIALIVGLFRECSLDSTSHNPLGEWTVQLSCDDIFDLQSMSKSVFYNRRLYHNYQ
jgi:hypothetical protein